MHKETAPLDPPTSHVAILIPSGSEWAAGFGFDLAHLCAYTGASLVADNIIDMSIHIVQTSILPSSRYSLVREAIKADATHLMWFDSDMRFPKDTLHRLLAHNKPMVAANYVGRRVPPVPVTFKSVDWEPGENGRRAKSRCYTTPEKTGLEQVDAVGFGVVLMTMAAVAAVPPPGFMITFGNNPPGWTGEDVHFCRALHDAGVPIYVDHDLSKEVRHVGTFEYGHEHVLEIPEEDTPKIILPGE